MSHAAPFPLLNHNHENSSRQQNSNQIKLPTVGQSPSPAHHDDFKSEVESELDFDDNFAEEEVDGAKAGAGEKLCSRLELPPGVTGAESCRSGVSSPYGESYIGDSCGSFEFLPKESPLRRLRRSVDKETPPRDIKREIEKRAANLQLLNVKTSSASEPQVKSSEHQVAEKIAPVKSDEVTSANPVTSHGTAESSKSGASRRSNGSDRRSSGGRSSGSDHRQRRRKNSQGSGGSNNETCLSNDSKKLANVEEVNKEEANCDMESDGGRQLRLVHNQVLLDMAKDIKPPPHEPVKSEIKSPKGKGKPSKSKETSSYGPMPNFEREIQKIIAEQVNISFIFLSGG